MHLACMRGPPKNVTPALIHRNAVPRGLATTADEGVTPCSAQCGDAQLGVIARQDRCPLATTLSFCSAPDCSPAVSCAVGNGGCGPAATCAVVPMLPPASARAHASVGSATAAPVRTECSCGGPESGLILAENHRDCDQRSPAQAELLKIGLRYTTALPQEPLFTLATEVQLLDELNALLAAALDLAPARIQSASVSTVSKSSLECVANLEPSAPPAGQHARASHPCARVGLSSARDQNVASHAYVLAILPPTAAMSGPDLGPSLLKLEPTPRLMSPGIF